MFKYYHDKLSHAEMYKYNKSKKYYRYSNKEMRLYYCTRDLLCGYDVYLNIMNIIGHMK